MDMTEWDKDTMRWRKRLEEVLKSLTDHKRDHKTAMGVVKGRLNEAEFLLKNAQAHIAELERKLAESEARVERLRDAASRCIPCLTDWVESTGFGEVNRRDRNALTGLHEALSSTAPAIEEFMARHDAEVLREAFSEAAKSLRAQDDLTGWVEIADWLDEKAREAAGETK